MARLAAILLAAVLLSTGPAAAELVVPLARPQITLSFAPVVQKSAPAVVNIYATRIVAERVSPFAADPFFSQLFGGLDRTVPRVQNSLGSGVIVDDSGIVVSNFHVVGEATAIRAVLADRREFDATVLLADQEADLAIIRLEDARDLPALDFADSETAQVGDLVLAIGNPFGVGQTVTSGIVSGLARSGGMVNGTGYYIQTDAPINPGNSGGALVDMNGRLLGINTSILTRSGGSNGIGFAIPSNLVARYVQQAAEGRTEFVRPWAGIAVQPVEASLAEALDLALPSGVVITQMHPQSPFAAAGLKTGDVLLAIEGMPVNAPPELDFRLATLGPGRKVSVAYMRDGKRRRASVKLIEPPQTPPADPRTIASGGPFDGLSVARLNPALVDRLGLPLTADGVVVVAVEGPAAYAGLRPGDIVQAVNGQAVETTGDLEALLSEPRPYWELKLLRGGQAVRLRLG